MICSAQRSALQGEGFRQGELGLLHISGAGKRAFWLLSDDGKSIAFFVFLFCFVCEALLRLFSAKAEAVVMLSLKYLLRSFVYVATLLEVVSGYGELPSLAEATAEELAAGLEAKQFNSVDLVNVCDRHQFEDVCSLRIGIRWTHSRSQFNPPRRHGDQPRCLEDSCRIGC